MNVLDLFSGIGGFSLGLERAGHRTVAFCECEPHAQTILRKHWPEVPIYPDVSSLTVETLKTDRVPTIDIICGGFPCQDISIANIEGQGLEGDRSGLWREYLRIIKEVRPKYVLIENVANLRNKGLAVILKNLWEIGYDAEWHIIPASSVGLPQRRERLWIIAYPTSQRVQECVLQRSEPFSKEPEKPGFGDGWVSEWLASWIRGRIVSRGYGLPGGVVRDAVARFGNSIVPRIPHVIGEALTNG